MRLWLVSKFGRVVLVIALLTLAGAHGRAEAAQAPARQLAAAPPPLVTDRPDFTESSEVVGNGLMQLEIGTTLEADRVAGTSRKTVTVPLALFRVGLGSRVEFRVSSAGFEVNSVRSGGVSSRDSGASDVELGAKLVIINRPATGFAVAAVPMVSLPTGSSGQSSGGYDPTLKLTWAKDLTAGLAVSGNVNFSWLTDDAGRLLQRATSVSLSHDVAGAWAAYWEVFGFTPPERGAKTAWTFDAGVTRGLGANAQLDLEVGRGLNSSAPDWFIGAGFAVRIAPFRRGR